MTSWPCCARADLMLSTSGWEQRSNKGATTPPLEVFEAKLLCKKAMLENQPDEPLQSGSCLPRPSPFFECIDHFPRALKKVWKEGCADTILKIEDPRYLTYILDAQRPFATSVFCFFLFDLGVMHCPCRPAISMRSCSGMC